MNTYVSRVWWYTIENNSNTITFNTQFLSIRSINRSSIKEHNFLFGAAAATLKKKKTNAFCCCIFYPTVKFGIWIWIGNLRIKILRES
jgi:hypothetical protein